MSPKHLLRFSALFMSLFLGGCVAKFEPRLSSLHSLEGGLPTVREVREGLEMSLEEFVSANKSRRAFDADIASRGVLPLLLRAENKGTRDYRVQRRDVRAFLNGQPLAPIYGYEAAKKGGTREYVGKALVNTAMLGPLAMYFWPVTIGLSTQHTKNINQDIERHFEAMEFTGAMVRPDETVAGFVYFRLPERSNRLENLTVELTAETNGYEERNGKQLGYKFSFPILAISSLELSPATSEENGVER